MKLVCENCKKIYLIKDTAIPAKGKTVRCQNCNHSWLQKPDQVNSPNFTTQNSASMASNTANNSPIYTETEQQSHDLNKLSMAENTQLDDKSVTMQQSGQDEQELKLDENSSEQATSIESSENLGKSSPQQSTLDKIPNFKPNLTTDQNTAETLTTAEKLTNHTQIDNTSPSTESTTKLIPVKPQSKRTTRKVSIFNAFSHSAIIILLVILLFQEALPEKAQNMFRLIGLYNTRGITIDTVNVHIFNEYGGKSVKLNGSIKNSSRRTLYMPDINIKMYDKEKKPTLSVKINNNGKKIKSNEVYNFDETIHNIPIDSYIMSVHAGNILESAMN